MGHSFGAWGNGLEDLFSLLAILVLGAVGILALTALSRLTRKWDPKKANREARPLSVRAVRSQAMPPLTQPQLPQLSDFPPHTRFVILEWDIPLACIPDGERCKWVNWYGGKPRDFPVTELKVDNNWPANSFEEWLALISDSIAAR